MTDRPTEQKRFFDFDETLHTFKPTQVNFFNLGKFVTSLTNRKKIHFEVRNFGNFGLKTHTRRGPFFDFFEILAQIPLR